MENNFIELSVEQLNENVFSLMNKDWMLITAKKPNGQINTMTAAWGCYGILWRRPVAICYIRPQRYTLEFVNSTDTFTLNFLEDGHRKDLNYCGVASGRDEDKITKCGFTLLGDPPYFGESKIVLSVKKLYCQQLGEEYFIDKSIIPELYPEADFHYMFVCKIEKVYIKK